MQKIFATIGAAALGLTMMAGSAFAATVNFTPWTFDPGNACDESATLNGNNSVTLSKPCPTATNASAGVSLQGVEGMSTTGMTLSFNHSGYCGAGAPRFNVYTDMGTIFLGCIHGDPGNTGTATFTAGNTYGGVLFPEGATITGIDIVQDEQGTVTISNITVNGMVATAEGQALKDACKKGGYQNLTDANGNTFRNQGQCVSYFNHQ